MRWSLAHRLYNIKFQGAIILEQMFVIVLLIRITPRMGRQSQAFNYETVWAGKTS